MRCNKCSSAKVVIRVNWTVPKGCSEPATWYCADHAQRFRDHDGGSWTCSGCKREGRSHRARITSVTDVTSYDEAREAWLENGMLADRDRMLEAVTLTEPASWDIYASIMAEPAPVVQAGRFRFFPALSPADRWRIITGMWVGILVMSILFFTHVV